MVALQTEMKMLRASMKRIGRRLAQVNRMLAFILQALEPARGSK
jgi:hypothetical protein